MWHPFTFSLGQIWILSFRCKKILFSFYSFFLLNQINLFLAFTCLTLGKCNPGLICSPGQTRMPGPHGWRQVLSYRDCCVSLSLPHPHHTSVCHRAPPPQLSSPLTACCSASTGPPSPPTGKHWPIQETYFSPKGSSACILAQALPAQRPWALLPEWKRSPWWFRSKDAGEILLGDKNTLNCLGGEEMTALFTRLPQLWE